MLPHTLEYDIIQAVKNVPKTGYLYSTQHPVQELKRVHDIDDETLCKTLKKLSCQGLLQEFHVRYSKYNPKHIDMYWFR